LGVGNGAKREPARRRNIRVGNDGYSISGAQAAARGSVPGNHRMKVTTLFAEPIEMEASWWSCFEIRKLCLPVNRLNFTSEIILASYQTTRR
jgi:hypothetical protein